MKDETRINYYLCFITERKECLYYQADNHEHFVSTIQEAHSFTDMDSCKDMLLEYPHNTIVKGDWYIRMVYKDVDLLLNPHGTLHLDMSE